MNKTARHAALNQIFAKLVDLANDCLDEPDFLEGSATTTSQTVSMLSVALADLHTTLSLDGEADEDDTPSPSPPITSPLATLARKRRKPPRTTQGAFFCLNGL